VLDILFIDPVNVYLQSERAVKYGILFIALTFAGFFLSEILRRSPIHPLQYLLVGLALAVFFLLLIALSEHLPFVAAYAIAASACIALIGSYLAGALGDRRQGLAFAAALDRTLRRTLRCPALRGQFAADGQRAALPGTWARSCWRRGASTGTEASMAIGSQLVADGRDRMRPRGAGHRAAAPCSCSAFHQSATAPGGEASSAWMALRSHGSMSSAGIASQVDSRKKPGQPKLSAVTPASGPTHTRPTAPNADSNAY
jgi:hypothetical protein